MKKRSRKQEKPYFGAQIIEGLEEMVASWREKVTGALWYKAILHARCKVHFAPEGGIVCVRPDYRAPSDSRFGSRFRSDLSPGDEAGGGPPMRRSKFTDEHIAMALRQAEAGKPG